MKKILFAIQWNPPGHSPNAVCDNRVLKELVASNKYEIHTLSYKTNGLSSYEFKDGVHCHRITKDVLSNLYDKNGTKKTARIIFKLERFIMRLKQIANIFIYPCYVPILAIRYVHRVKKLHKKYNFDLIIAEQNGLGPYAACYLKKHFSNIKALIVFWDTLSGARRAKYLPKSYTLKKVLKLENYFVANTDKSIVMESQRDNIERLYKYKEIFSKFIFLNIPFIVKPTISLNDTLYLNNDEVNVVFAGNLFLRNFELVVSLFKLLNERNIHLWLFCDPQYHKKIYALIENSSNVHVNSYISNEELAKVLQKADVLLNMGVTNPYAISGKIFEYMSYGKPIISTYSIDNEACIQFLEKYPLSFLIDERGCDLKQQAEELANFILLNKGKTVTFEEVQDRFRINTPKAYVDVIEQLLENNVNE